MKKWLLGVLLCLALLSSFVVPGVASAHSGKAMRPAATCYNTGCNGKWQDQTGCHDGLQYPLVDKEFTDSYSGLAFDLDLIYSPTCDAMWTESYSDNGAAFWQGDGINYNSGNNYYNNGPKFLAVMWSQMVGCSDQAFEGKFFNKVYQNWYTNYLNCP